MIDLFVKYVFPFQFVNTTFIAVVGAETKPHRGKGDLGAKGHSSHLNGLPPYTRTQRELCAQFNATCAEIAMPQCVICILSNIPL